MCIAKPLLILAFTSLVASAASGAVRIGTETLVALPSSALYHCEIGNQPDDGSVQTLNPPVFTWLYYENPSLFNGPSWSKNVRYFKLQLSPNANFSPLTWNIGCSNNFYNFLPPITNSDGSTFTGTNYWRIVYLDASGNTISSSITHKFVLASNAKRWDRSMLADTNYLIGMGTNHPHILFFQTNRDAMSRFLQTNVWPTPGYSWNAVTNDALSYITQSWWTNSSALTNLSGWNHYSYQISEVALAYQLTTNAALLAANPGGTFDMFVTNWLMQGWDRVDPYIQNVKDEMYFAECYDWLYPIMTGSQRSNALFAMESAAQFAVFEDWFYTGTAPNTNRVYTNALFCSYGSAPKEGESHSRNAQALLAMTMAGMGESAILRDMQTYFLNYYIAQFDPFQGYDGRWYNQVQNLMVDRQFAPFWMAALLFPEAVLTNAPIYSTLASLFAFMDPVGYYNPYTEAWGVRGNNDAVYYSQWNFTRFYDAALLLQSGPILRKYNRNKAFRNPTREAPLLGEAMLPYYWPPPVESDWPTNSWLDLVRGWCIAESAPPTDYGSFTNNVGFIFQAKPNAGGRLNAQTYTDGQLEMWAYGALVTVTGSGNYEQHCIFGNGLFVDGIGLNNPNPAVSDPWYARIYAFTNTSDFTFVAGDLTKAFARTNWYTSSYLNIETAFYARATNARPYISSVTRSVLFPHKRYLVIYDQLQTTKPAQFQWKWNVWQPTAVVNTNACSFTYTATNLYNGSNVTVSVSHMVDPSLMALTNMTTGQNLTGMDMNNPAKINPFTGENYNGTNDPYGPIDTQHYWASTIWVYNKTPTTNWHFLSVVYPVKWTDTAPVITRLDDYTVRVQQGTNNDVISFDANTTQPATLIIGVPAPAPPSRPAPPRNLRIR